MDFYEDNITSITTMATLELTIQRQEKREVGVAVDVKGIKPAE